MCNFPPFSARYPSEFLSFAPLPTPQQHPEPSSGQTRSLGQHASFVKWGRQQAMGLSLLVNGQNLGQKGGGTQIYCVK